jgi:hypothetical protein
MSQAPTLMRWRAALTRAARRTVAARWRNTLEALEAARLEHRALYTAAAVDVRASARRRREFMISSSCARCSRASCWWVANGALSPRAEVRGRVLPMSPE